MSCATTKRKTKKTPESKTDDDAKNYALIIAKRTFAKKRFLRRRIGANIRNLNPMISFVRYILFNTRVILKGDKKQFIIVVLENISTRMM